jgi:hypothetical protein
MHLLFIYGPPASGKLTIASQVARQSGYALFHNHLIVDALLAVFPFGSPEFVALREKFWIETIGEAARSGRSLVFTFCPEPTVDAGFSRRVEALVQQAGGPSSSFDWRFQRRSKSGDWLRPPEPEESYGASRSCAPGRMNSEQRWRPCLSQPYRSTPM